MKDGAGITDNRFDGGADNSVQKTVLGIPYGSPVRERGSTFKRDFGLGLEDQQDTIILQGKREDYQFTFLNDANPSLGNYTGSVKIKHFASGAENTFQNYQYIVFGGRENENNPSQYVKVSQIKMEEVAKAAAVEHTYSKVALVPENTPKQVPPIHEENSLSRKNKGSGITQT